MILCKENKQNKFKKLFKKLFTKVYLYGIINYNIKQNKLWKERGKENEV